MSVRGAQEKIAQAVLSWEGVSAHPHRFGGTEFRIGRRELGHIHGDHLVDIPFPKKVRDEVVSTGFAKEHHVLPESGWVSCYLKQEGDMEKAIELMQYSYRLALHQKLIALRGPRKMIE
jgi:hypothetical protein